MTFQDVFPQELLERPVADRVAYFNRYTMAHPNLVKSAQALMDYIKEPAGAPLIFLFGPTGVGKSTLLRRVHQKITEALLEELETDRGRIPIAGIEAMAPEFSNFDWRDFYLRALEALQAPGHHSQTLSRKQARIHLRFSLEEALRYRRPDVFYIDEAQNLGKVASGRKLRDQTDCIKSLANLCDVQFVLVGTYELLMLRNLSAQLCRRSVDIHFPRYQAESIEDLQIFRNVVQTFQHQLPLIKTPNLSAYWDFCFERSIGCVGILKNWLSHVLATVLTQDPDAKTLTIKQLEQHAPSLDKCIVMINEAKQDEARLEGRAVRSELRLALGLELATNQIVEPTSNRKKHGVGKPSPKRHPVGGG